ncbi:MAG: ACP S-malonyltransferase [Wenzhouxiangellaceae bacterium]
MKTAFLFPGQGSQSVGMLADLATRHAQIRTTFDEASSALGDDLWALVQQGPEDRLNETRWTQPVMLAADIALWRVYTHANGAVPEAMAGHSLGEYAALVAAGAMSLADAIRVVHERGRLMQSAVGPGEGAMAAILGLEDQLIEDICARHDGAVPANYNAPGQLVIAGRRDAVEAAAAECRTAGAKRVVLLPVSVPAHSPLMAPAEAGLRLALDRIEIRPPRVTVIHNADLEAHPEPGAIREALVAQLTRPVRWTETIARLQALGAGRFVECGPGRVLTGLGRRIDRQAEWIALDDAQSLATLTADKEDL